MTTPKKVPAQAITAGEPVAEVPTTEATTEPQPDAQRRSGLFARMTTDEDVSMVQQTVTFLKPALKVAGAAVLINLAPVTGTGLVVNEAVHTLHKRYKARQVAKEIENLT